MPPSSKSLEKAMNAIDQVRESLLKAFVKHPETLQHLLLVGPPGCGKTTTARKIIENFYGTAIPPGTALFLNASDERGLDSIRAKIYPFIQCRPILPSETPSPPRFIILDEAETLTESAQLALRPVFENSASQVCLIFIVNCISGIHPSLRHRFLRLQFMPPSVKTLESRIANITSSTTLKVPKLLDAFRWRGDLRHFLLQPQDYNILTEELYQWLHEPSSIKLRKSNLDSAEDIICVGYLFKILDIVTIRELLNITDPFLIKVSSQEEQRNRLETIVAGYRKKLEALTPF